MKNWKQTILEYDPPFILGSVISVLGIAIYDITQQCISSNYNMSEISSYLMAIAGSFFITLGTKKDLIKYASKEKIPIILLGIILTLLFNLYSMSWSNLLSILLIYIIPYLVAKANENDKKKTY